MYRIGYAENGITNWQREGFILGPQADLDWMDTHVRSPSIIHIDPYYLMAFEGWGDDAHCDGIGFALAERAGEPDTSY